METVVGDISRGIQQLKNLSDVTLAGCCVELTRGVVEGLTDHKFIYKVEVKGEIFPPSKIFQICTTHLQQYIIGANLSKFYISVFNSKISVSVYVIDVYIIQKHSSHCQFDTYDLKLLLSY